MSRRAIAEADTFAYSRARLNGYVCRRPYSFAEGDLLILEHDCTATSAGVHTLLLRENTLGLFQNFSSSCN
jgi:hypothetical protein